MAGCPFLRLGWCLPNSFKVSQGRLGLVGWQAVEGKQGVLSFVTCWSSSEPSLIITGVLSLLPTHPLHCVLASYWHETLRLCLRANNQTEYSHIFSFSGYLLTNCVGLAA